LENEFSFFDQFSELIIDGYPNLREINNYGNILQITKVTISNCPQLEVLDISGFKNNQELILSNLPNLKEINCESNQLTILDLTNYFNLGEINFHDNLLTEIKLPNPGKRLETL